MANNLYARFYIHAQLQQVQSEKEGRPVYKDVEYVEILIKGQPNSTMSRPVSAQDKIDFEKEYKAFKDGNPDLAEGTPVKFLPGVGPSQVLEFRQMGIHTIEDIADLTDAALDNIRGGRMLMQRAKAYLATLEIKPELEEIIEDSPVDVESMQRDTSVAPKTTRKRGRPKKTEAA